MEVYRTPSKEIQEIILANVTYETVINGLNGYFTSEPRNDYITVKMESDDIKQDFALYEAETWADILISWLRTKHEIFYYPGMEAKYAKSEKIRPFTERMMDEGALKCLKALYKCVIGQEVGINSHTLIADGIKCAVSIKESEIKKMKKRIAELESNFKAVCVEDDIFRTRALKAEEEVRKLKVELNAVKDTVSQVRSRLNNKFCHLGYEEDLVKLADIAVKAVDARDETISHIKATAQKEAVCKDIMNYIRQEASRNGFEIPEEIDGEPLTIKRVFHDLLELMRKRGAEIKGVNDKRLKDLRDIYRALGRYNLYDDVDDFLKAVKARAEWVECLSRNAERETRKAVNEQLKKDTDYIVDTLCDILEILGISKSNTAHLDIPGLKDKAIQRASVIKSEHDRYLEQLDKATADYQAKLKDYILKGIKKRGSRYDGLQSKSVGEIVDWIITMATVDRANIALRDIYTTVASPAERFRYNIDNCDGTTVDHMKDYILRRFEGLHANTEYCLKKMSEFDTKVSAKDDEISRLKGLINAMNEEVKDM